MTANRGQSMGGQARLERGYRRLLAFYPQIVPARERGRDPRGAAGLCSGWAAAAGLAASADLIKAAIRMRLWPASRPRAPCERRSG